VSRWRRHISLDWRQAGTYQSRGLGKRLEYWKPIWGRESGEYFWRAGGSSSNLISWAASSTPASKATTSKVLIIIWLTALCIVETVYSTTPVFSRRTRICSARSTSLSINRMCFPEVILLIKSLSFRFTSYLSAYIDSKPIKGYSAWRIPRLKPPPTTHCETLFPAPQLPDVQTNCPSPHRASA